MTEKNLFRIGFFGVLLGCLISFSACGSDSSSSATHTPGESSNSENDLSSAGTGPDGNSSQSGNTTNSSASAKSNNSSSPKTETPDSPEALSEADKSVNGTCEPAVAEIKKGEFASWIFHRTEGDVFDQVMSPFVWTLPGTKSKTKQGDGMDVVDIAYENAGTYTATLNVDGNEITCSPLQVQGIPITIDSCKANIQSANVGETITWTVAASSESDITGYTWSSTYGAVSENGTSATMVASADMHKKNVNVTVTVSNKDNTNQSYACPSVKVIDPSIADVTLAVGENKDIPTGQDLVVGIPTCPSSNGKCVLVCNFQALHGETAMLTSPIVTCSQNNNSYIECDVTAQSGKKVPVFIDCTLSTIPCKIESR